MALFTQRVGKIFFHLRALLRRQYWPLFTGGKRIFASRIGNRMVDLAKAGREEAGATLQSELVETYYALSLYSRIRSAVIRSRSPFLRPSRCNS